MMNGGGGAAGGSGGVDGGSVRRGSGGGAGLHNRLLGSSSNVDSRGVRFRRDVVQPEIDAPSMFSNVMGIMTGLIAVCACAGLMTVLVVLYVTVRPFSNTTYRRLASTWGLAAFLDATSILLPHTKIHLTGDSDVPSPLSSSILVCNHICESDWYAIFLLGRCVGLHDLKAFLRNEYLHINMENVDGSSPTVSSSTSTSSSPLTLAHANGHQQTGSTTTIGGSMSEPQQQATSSSRNTTQTTNTESRRGQASQDLTLVAKLLHLFMEFPLINGETSDREPLLKLMRSFASASDSDSNPVHLLFYPEGWSIHNGHDREFIHQKSNQFAKREGKPELHHLLLPRTRWFNTSLECLREAAPVVYDITMAYSGYDGSLPQKEEMSMTTLWDLLRRKFPRDIHMRIKRYSMEEVTKDSNWLFKKWAEKDRLLSHFARHQQFPTDSRGYCRSRVFDTQRFNMERSIVSLLRLLFLPCTVPFLLLVSFPLFWTLLVIWIGQRLIWFMFPSDGHGMNNVNDQGGQRTPGSASAAGTPYLPATPFASPTVLNWRDTYDGPPPTQDH